MRNLTITRLATAVTLTLTALTTTTAQEWKELGPAPITSGNYVGRIAAIATSPTDPDTYYVGSAEGGVWKTTDGGDSWTPRTDHMPMSAIGAMAIDPSNEDIVYAGTGEANYANHSLYGVGLYKSRNGGNTWRLLAEGTFGGRCFSKLLIDPTDTRTLYASITRAGGFPELAAAKGHPGATGPLGVFKSTDGGKTWAHLTNGLPSLSATDLTMDMLNPQVLYAGIGRIFGDSQNGIYKTTDGGASWNKLGGGLPVSNVGRVAVAVAPSNSNRLFTMIARPSGPTGSGASTLGGWRSNDSGATWESIPLGSPQSFGWYYSVVAVDPTVPATAFFGGLTLVRTTNSGGSFSSVTPPHVDLHAIAWDAAGRLLAGDDGGLHRSTNNGNTWSSLNNGLGTIQFYAGLSSHPTDDTIVFGGTQDNGSNRRNTDTRNWTQVFGGDGGWTQLDQQSPNVVFVEFQGTGTLYKSTNGGNSFSSSGSGISGGDRNAFLPPYLIDATASNRMYYCTHRVYRSLNAGGNWSVISGDLTTGTGAIRAIAMGTDNPMVLYCATNDGNVQVSSDGGFNWTLSISGNPGFPRVTRELFVDPLDADTAYLGVGWFGVDQILRTTDRGVSWTPLDQNFPDIPVNTIAADTRGNVHTIFAGTDSGLYRSDDGGQTWGEYGQGLPNVPIVDVSFDVNRERLLVGTQGRGAWTVPVIFGKPHGKGSTK